MRIRTLGILALVAAAAGCGGGEPRIVIPELHPVEGTVTYVGKPAKGVRVTFLPASGAIPGMDGMPWGETGSDGRFRLTTLKDSDGAPAGGYRVVLSWPAVESGTDGEVRTEPGADRLLDWYDTKHTRLDATVQPGPNSLPPFNLPEVKRPPEEVHGVFGMN